jgi:hypothetical protein
MSFQTCTRTQYLFITPRCTSLLLSPFSPRKRPPVKRVALPPFGFSFQHHKVTQTLKQTDQTTQGRSVDPAVTAVFAIRTHKYARADPCPMTGEWAPEAVLNMSEYSNHSDPLKEVPQ